MEITITKDNFQEQVLDATQPVLIDFWATWCGPCQMMGPVVAQIAAERSDIKVGKVNVDDEQQLAASFGIQSIPTLVLMKNGKPAAHMVGYRDKAAVDALIAEGLAK